MHPLFARRLRPIAAVVLVFFSWFSIEPWNYALAAQDAPVPRVTPASASQQKAPTAPEVFETTLRAIKEQVRAARDGDAFQAQLAGLLKSLEQAVAQGSHELEASRRAVDRLARAVEHGAPSQDALKALQSQQQTVKAAVGQVRLNASGIEGLLRGMALPTGLAKDQKQAKEAVSSLLKAFDATLSAMTQRADQQRGFEAQEHQAFLAAGMDLDKGLATLQMRVQALAKEATPERRRAQLWERAFSQRDSVLVADRAIRKEFDQTEAFLKEKGLPQEILDRHDAAVSDYEKNFNQLKGYLAQVDQAHQAYVSATERGNETSAQATERDLESKLSAFDDFLKVNVKEPPHQPLDPNNLPHRTPKPQERKPRLKKEEFAEFQPQIRLAYNGDPGNLLLAQATSDLPKPEDLTQTIEVQFTPEIQALAAELEHNPVKIYSWVRNNIDFVPTYGSIQGAQACLVTKQCNDMDTASLLIALLRTSGVAARYVMGTIEVPMTQVMNWVGGFTDERAALDFIASAGTPVSMGSFSGGKVSTAFIEHVWADAYVDFIPSRGARHQQGDTWIPLDASFKQYTYQQGVNLHTAMPFDAQAFIDQITATATINEAESSATNIDATAIQTALRTLRDQLTTHVTDTMPNATVGEVIGGKHLVVQTLPRLPATLPYRVAAQGATRADLPGVTRHQITMEVPGGPLSIGASLSYTSPLSSVAAQRVTLSYVPATSADQEVIASLFPGPHADGSPILPEELPAAFPAYLINLTPELRVNGVVVATGEAIRMGAPQELTITFADPAGTGSDRVTHAVTAGDYLAVVLNAGGVSTKRLTDQQAGLEALKTKIDAQDIGSLTKDDLIGDLLNSVIVTYFYETDTLDKLTAQLMNAVHLRLPSEGAFILSLKTNYLFGVPKSVGPAGMTMDVPRLFYTVKARDGNPSTTWQFGLVAGPMASALEHSVPEQLLSTSTSPVEAISAVEALSLANSQGLPVYTITSLNAASVLPNLAIPDLFLDDIKDAINAGKVVTVSKTMVVFKGRAVLGYVAIDPQTGAGAYIIGGSNGGLADVAFNTLLGLVWGLLYVTAFATILLGAPFFVPLLLSISATMLIAGLKFSYTGDSGFNPVATLIELALGYIGGLFFQAMLPAGALFAPVLPLAALSPLFIALVVVSITVVVTLLVLDYMFTFAMNNPQRRRRLYASA